MAEEETFANFLQATGGENAKQKKKTGGESEEDRKSAHKSKLQKEQSKAELEAAIRKRVDCEEKAFRVVERLLDNPVDTDFFVNCAQYIEPSHYADVLVERSIVGQCGYPVCSNKLPKTKPKQQYHIDTRHNKVYDITERKNFCSNWCYKASQFYKNQLFTSPVWARDKEKPVPVRLLQMEGSSEVTSESCSSQGDHQGSTGKEDSTEENLQTTQVHLKQECTEDSTTLEHTKETDDSGESSGQGAEVKFSKLSLSDSVVKHDNGVGKEDREDASETYDKTMADRDSSKEDILDVEKKVSQPKTVTVNEGQEEENQTMTEGRQEDTSGGVEKIPSGEGEDVVLQTAPAAVVQTRHDTAAPMTQVSVAQTVFKSLMEWRTEMTFKFLYGGHVEVNLVLPEVLRFTTQEELRAAAGTTQEQDASLQHHDNQHHGNQHHDNQHHGNQHHDNQHHGNQHQGNQHHGNQQHGNQQHGNQQHGNQQHGNQHHGNKHHDNQHHGNQHHGNHIHGNKHHGNNTSQQMADENVVKAEHSKKVRFQEDQKDFTQPLSICIPEDPCQNDEEVQLGSLQGKDPKESQDGHVYQGGPDLDPCDTGPATRPLPDLATLRRDAALFQMRVQEFYRGGTQLPVSQEEGLEVTEKRIEDDDEHPVILPPVDSQAQRALQQKILLDRLNRVFPSVLAPLRLSVRDFSTELNLLVKTFRLTSDNIVFRPAELKLLAVVLIHILATKVQVIMQSLYCPETAQFLTSLLRPWRLDLQDLDALVSVMRLG
ncbi:putative RNA polymerase II subunit B1 CTD phosphatase RPAP2 [Branchiostoma floridae]|uniref:RNA polymerase II subunit B1 CTD phosphatase RPAP2 homolog n=1 Tax=Branchiostoma floridae TaxID=7739 RepID=A0A9J7MZB9_BRAFL|nr:putative RNA polymerase II subunit B1 CTD phosphatase RPAP2 [Branchiostoma floridae]